MQSGTVKNPWQEKMKAPVKWQYIDRTKKQDRRDLMECNNRLDHKKNREEK